MIPDMTTAEGRKVTRQACEETICCARQRGSSTPCVQKADEVISDCKILLAVLDELDRVEAKLKKEAASWKQQLAAAHEAAGLPAVPNRNSGDLIDWCRDKRGLETVAQEAITSVRKMGLFAGRLEQRLVAAWIEMGLSRDRITEKLEELRQEPEEMNAAQAREYLNQRPKP